VAGFPPQPAGKKSQLKKGLLFLGGKTGPGKPSPAISLEKKASWGQKGKGEKGRGAVSPIPGVK